MNKIISILLSLATLLCASCSWEELPDISEIIEEEKKQEQYYGQAAADSANTDYKVMYEQNDSTKETSELASAKPSNEAENNDSLCCYVQVRGRLIIEGAAVLDYSHTCVTVEKIIVKAWIDDADSATIYQPEIWEGIAEPESAYEWSDMPEGVKYSPLPLLAQPIVITYEHECHIEAIVSYLVRTDDYTYVTDCRPDKHECTANGQPNGLKYEKLNVDVPLRLVTIQMGAAVSEEKDGLNQNK